MRSLRFVFPLFVIVALVYWIRTSRETSSRPSFFDVPKTLSEEKMTIQVWLHRSAGGVEVWSLSKSGGEADRIYLQPARPSQTIPAQYYRLKDSGYVLQLYGAFYKGEGIPEAYFNRQPIPQRYPVFRYESLEVAQE